MSETPIRPPENIPTEEIPEPEWPPKEWLKDDARAARDGDPERGQHLIWVALAAIMVLIALWAG